MEPFRMSDKARSRERDGEHGRSGYEGSYSEIERVDFEPMNVSDEQRQCTGTKRARHKRRAFDWIWESRGASPVVD